MGIVKLDDAVKSLREERRIANQIKRDQNFVGCKVGNLEALGLDDETNSALTQSLKDGVDPAQLKYFKQANKDALSESIKEYDVDQHMQDAASELGVTIGQNEPQARPTKEEIQQLMDAKKTEMDAVLASSRSKGAVQNAYEGVGNYLWGGPQMRGHIK